MDAWRSYQWSTMKSNILMCHKQKCTILIIWPSFQNLTCKWESNTKVSPYLSNSTQIQSNPEDLSWMAIIQYICISTFSSFRMQTFLFKTFHLKLILGPSWTFLVYHFEYLRGWLMSSFSILFVASFSMDCLKLQYQAHVLFA